VSESLDGVSETALGAAEMRAEEREQPDPLFDDPYAAGFVAAAPPLFPDLPSLEDDPQLSALKDAFLAEIAIRTRFYDDYLLSACAAGCRQIVILAAGLDARAFRLDWPAGVQVFELDLPNLFAFKEQVLDEQHATPRCARSPRARPAGSSPLPAPDGYLRGARLSTRPACWVSFMPVSVRSVCVMRRASMRCA
jgi:O-methyltransferase involved in polyketide biosynthesis